MALDQNATQVDFHFVFDFEKDFNYEQITSWLKYNWPRSLIFATIYVTLVFYIQKVMKTRAEFDLRKPLFLWNLGLAIFSIFGTWRFVAEMWYVWSRFGFEFTVCNASYHRDNIILAHWAWLFVVSKVIELGDTFFVILRKRPLIFLHWYHHLTVLIYTWYSGYQLVATGRWFITMNFVAHSFMYSYYALRAANFAIPKPIAMSITVIQLLQMVIGLLANLWAYGVLTRGDVCETNLWNIWISLLMYFSYFLLFIHYFRKNYVLRVSVSKHKSKTN